MIWMMAKTDHNMAIKPWVRTWLRAGAGKRLVIILLLLMGMWLTALGLSAQGEDFLGVAKGLSWLLLIGWVVDAAIEGLDVQSDIKRMMRVPDVALATRGEYIGGHPQLPHGRFVYLALGGSRENPGVDIVLPKGENDGEAYSMPLLDVQEASERRKATGNELSVGTTISGSLASISFRRKFIGEQAFLNVSYSGAAGRKHIVEIGNFILGDAEVQNWRNYIVCSQAEADTGQAPHGPWKSLPSAPEEEQAS